MKDYKQFLAAKERLHRPSGFDCEPGNVSLFDFQRDAVRWALKKGKAALFLDTGLGKTNCQLSWADEISRHEQGKVLILAPLAVSRQTRQEGEKFGIPVTVCRMQNDVTDGINITNYEMFINGHFDPNEFVGVVLDESSIIKAFDGKTTQTLIEQCRSIPYRLACTATPAPNDYMELGNHAAFLGVMSRAEMLATYFVHDSKDTAEWRLKGHAKDGFWRWIASWGLVIRHPRDLGYDADGYDLPPLNIVTHLCEAEKDGYSLFAPEVTTLTERRDARKKYMVQRVEKCRELALQSERAVIWCELNDESAALTKAIPDAVEVKGSDSSGHKEKSILGFANGEIRYIVTKPSLAGFGINWQICDTAIYCGLSDSYEKFYQSVRRLYRFGQKNPVNVHIVMNEVEAPIIENIRRKEQSAQEMQIQMVSVITDILKHEITNTVRITESYTPNISMKLPGF